MNRTVSIALIAGASVLGAWLAAATPAAAQARWRYCAAEGRTCYINGSYRVRYGANGAYVYARRRGSFPCNNDWFGDPLVGVVKACYVLAY